MQVDGTDRKPFVLSSKHLKTAYASWFVDSHRKLFAMKHNGFFFLNCNLRSLSS